MPAQTWRDIMVAAHQGIEIKEIPGIGAGTKNPAAVPSANVASSTPSAKPGPPPVLTRRGADILVRVEKMLEEASKTAGRTSSNEPVAPKPRASALAFPDSLASAGDAPAAAPAPASRKN